MYCGTLAEIMAICTFLMGNYGYYQLIVPINRRDITFGLLRYRLSQVNTVIHTQNTSSFARVFCIYIIHRIHHYTYFVTPILGRIMYVCVPRCSYVVTVYNLYVGTLLGNRSVTRRLKIERREATPKRENARYERVCPAWPYLGSRACGY